MQGARFQVFFDEKLVFEAQDETFKDPGKVGLWTKADSVTYFDNLSIWLAYKISPKICQDVSSRLTSSRIP